MAGDYDGTAADVDTFMWEHQDMLITYSAGNDGVDANSNGVVDNDSIGSPATAKNVLTVGASENQRPNGFPCDASLSYGAAPHKGVRITFLPGMRLGQMVIPPPPSPTIPGQATRNKWLPFSAVALPMITASNPMSLRRAPGSYPAIRTFTKRDTIHSPIRCKPR